MSEEPRGLAPTPEPRAILKLDGFEGPMDLLLDLARGQKVDLARISILDLVEQYLAVVDQALRVRLELAADWLVMAAWLAWLKSRLLAPAPDRMGEPEAVEAAEALAARLDALEHVQRAARWLGARPQLGHEVFARGRPEDMVAVDRSGLAADLPQLVRAYMAAVRRGSSGQAYVPPSPRLWTVAEATARLTRMLGRTLGAGWVALERFLPHVAGDPAQRRAALASTLLAGLELARSGQADLRQDAPFGPVLVRGMPDGP